MNIVNVLLPRNITSLLRYSSSEEEKEEEDFSTKKMKMIKK